MSHQLDDYITILTDYVVSGQVDFMKLEKEVFRLVKQMGCQLVGEVLEAAEERLFKEKPKEYESVGFRKKTLTTIIGNIEVRRRLWKRREAVSGKHEWVCKLDERLGLQSHETSSLGLQEIALSMGAEKSYRKASELMGKVDLELSHSKIHQLIQQAGKRIRAYEAEQTKTEGTESAEMVVIESDGIYVSRQNQNVKAGQKKKKGLEIKVGIVYEGWEATSPSGTSFRLKNKKTTATEGDSTQYWNQMDRLLQSRYDVGKVDHFLFGSDGAAWGKEGALRYGRSIHQVDAFHFQRMIKRTFGFGEKSMVDTIQSLVDAGEKEGFKALMKHSREKFKAEEKMLVKIAKLNQFILKNWDSIPDYRNRGLDLPKDCRGTGSIENSVDNLVADRMKKQGMAWSEAGAGNLIRVRVAIQNGVLSEAMCYVKAVEERHEQSKKKTERKGRPKATKTLDQSTWLQAGMPALHGSEQNMREFASSLLRMTTSL